MTEVRHTLAVAFKHFDVGKHVVPERDGLRHLHVRKARHDRVVFLVGLRNEYFLKVIEQPNDLIDFAPQIETNVGSHLVVAAAARVKAFAGVTDQGRKARFNVEVHVFELKLPEKLAGLDFIGDRGHAVADVGKILFADDAALCEHCRVRERPLNVGHRHALIETHRLRVSEHELGNGFREAA